MKWLEGQQETGLAANTFSIIYKIRRNVTYLKLCVERFIRKISDK